MSGGYRFQKSITSIEPVSGFGMEIHPYGLKKEGMSCPCLNPLNKIFTFLPCLSFYSQNTNFKIVKIFLYIC